MIQVPFVNEYVHVISSKGSLKTETYIALSCLSETFWPSSYIFSGLSTPLMMCSYFI